MQSTKPFATLFDVLVTNLRLRSSTSQPRLYEALFSDRVLNAVRVELADTYKAETDQRVKLEEDDCRTAIHDLLTPLDF